jgi:hypothetical protein
MSIDHTRTLRGALSGAVAATVWAAQQPLDKIVFGCRYDDVELLGKAVARGGRWRAAGFAWHVGNGALFGAAYSVLAPSMPLPPALRGPASALAENFAGWPLGTMSDRFHPARDELPKLAGNGRAFAQATWRHLLFGVVLGELERRLNAEPEPTPPQGEVEFSTNGHGSIDRAVSVLVEPGS